MASGGVHFLSLWLLLPFLFLLISENIKFVVCSRTLSLNQSDVQPKNISETVIQPQAPPSSSFSSYILAVQWPPSICSSKPSGSCRFPVPNENFTIHGLWPQSHRSPHPSRCNPSDKLNITNLNSVRGELDIKWPTLFLFNTNEQFWAHEWDVHGTCSGLSQLDYFRKTLNLFSKNVNLLANLKAIKVAPDDTKTYNPSTVVSGYDSKYKVKPRITCVLKTGTPDVVEMFADFRFKVNKDTETIESMTGITTSCKTTAVGFPKTG